MKVFSEPAEGIHIIIFQTDIDFSHLATDLSSRLVSKIHFNPLHVWVFLCNYINTD